MIIIQNMKYCKCKDKPYKFCEEHGVPECYYHHLELHPVKINIDFLSEKIKETKGITGYKYPNTKAKFRT